ncbi:MAG: hypothetical protein PHP04_04085 [Bacteroidales bacterium]|nr:hypothetical protein [Bacteroidales bacterium]HNW73929.1 hypothetical protein [Bacteroidales bacterium]
MRKFLIWFITVVVIIGAIFIYWKFYFTYSVGHRAGLLQKFSYRGVIFKTYEGELILSSVQSNKNVTLASEKFFFSVSNEKVAKQMEQLQGYFMTLHYQEKNGVLWWRGDTKYLVDSITVNH